MFQVFRAREVYELSPGVHIGREDQPGRTLPLPPQLFQVHALQQHPATRTPFLLDGGGIARVRGRLRDCVQPTPRWGGFRGHGGGRSLWYFWDLSRLRATNELNCINNSCTFHDVINYVIKILSRVCLLCEWRLCNPLRLKWILLEIHSIDGCGLSTLCGGMRGFNWNKTKFLFIASLRQSFRCCFCCSKYSYMPGRKKSKSILCITIT